LLRSHSLVISFVIGGVKIFARVPLAQQQVAARKERLLTAAGWRSIHDRRQRLGLDELRSRRINIIFGRT
jgi:hypothetical protein